MSNETTETEVEKAEKRVADEHARVRLGLAALSVVVDAQADSENYDGRAIARMTTAATSAILGLRRVERVLALAKMCALVMAVPPTSERIETWTVAQVIEVENWATLSHMAAGSCQIPIPRRPAILGIEPAANS